MVKCDCPIETVAQIIGSKWVILILKDLFLGKSRFNEFLESNPNLHNKVLASKLKEMQKNGLIERVTSKDSLEINYVLTPLGHSFKPAFAELASLGKTYCNNETEFTRYVEVVTIKE